MGKREGYPKSATAVSAVMTILDAVAIATGISGFVLAHLANEGGPYENRYDWGAGETWLTCLVSQIYFFPWNKFEGTSRAAAFKWSILNVTIHSIFCMGYACAVGYYKYERFDMSSI